MLLLVLAPVNAQDDEKAAGAAIDTIIRVFSEYEIVDRFVADIYSKYEKDKVKAPILAARIAKAYYNYVMVPGNPTPQFHRRDVAKAFEYLDKAIAIDPKYPQSYLVASDIFYNEAKIDTALIWLDKGIEANPTDSSLYIESAKLLCFSNRDAAVQKLMVLKERDSTFQVDLQLGRLFYKSWRTAHERTGRKLWQGL
jgi:tetratricopeptide (TPR) repeat protein